MGIYIPREMEHVTYKELKPFEKDLTTLGINFITSHNDIVPLKTFTQIPSRNLLKEPVVLMNNACYMYCRPTDSVVVSVSDNFKKWKRTLKKPHNVAINVLGHEECDYHHLMDVALVNKMADIVFTHAYGDAGWYNLKFNILWLSDLAHFSLSKYFAQVIKGIMRVRAGETDAWRNQYLDPNTLTWGADPEFEVYKGGKHIPANQVIPDDHTAPVGCDGYNVTGEVRPRPSPSPLGLARNIKRLMYSMAFTHGLIDYEVLAGEGKTHHLGGHIHVSTQIPDNHALVLYDLVGAPVLKYQQGPRKDRADIVARGAWDSVRPNPRKLDPLPHSGQEWRQLPSFIESEETTKICLCTAAMVIKELQIKEIDPKKTSKMTQESKCDLLRSMKLYPVYAKYVEDFIERFYIKGYSMVQQVVFKGWDIKKLDKVPMIRVESSVFPIKRTFPPVTCPSRGKSLLIKILPSPDNATLYVSVHESIEDDEYTKIRRATKQFALKRMIHYSVDKASSRSLGADGNTDVISVYLPAQWRGLGVEVLAPHLVPLITDLTNILV